MPKYLIREIRKFDVRLIIYQRQGAVANSLHQGLFPTYTFVRPERLLGRVGDIFFLHLHKGGPRKHVPSDNGTRTSDLVLTLNNHHLGLSIESLATHS